MAEMFRPVYYVDLTAAGTGFRASELASLKPESFALEAEPPTATVRAGYSKNRKEACQPLPTEVAETLRNYLTSKAAGQPLWPGTWKRQASKRLSHIL